MAQHPDTLEPMPPVHPDPKGKAKMSKFTKVPPPDSLPPGPSQEASRTGISQADDSFGLTSINDILTLCPVASVKASRTARADHELQWVDFLMGKNNFLYHVQAASWLDDHFASLTKIFFFLKTHPMCQKPHGHEIVMHYASYIHHQWHDLLKLGDNRAFNISEVNQSLMNTIAFEVNSLHQARLACKVIIPLLFSQILY
ncbi:hypothetical protein JVU11DRAFT_3174 [Chiua virens]|nr:hypothetical protein JVU11DRAFT_3174 [Chiua virens]